LLTGLHLPGPRRQSEDASGRYSCSIPWCYEPRPPARKSLRRHRQPIRSTLDGDS